MGWEDTSGFQEERKRGREEAEESSMDHSRRKVTKDEKGEVSW